MAPKKDEPEGGTKEEPTEGPKDERFGLDPEAMAVLCKSFVGMGKDGSFDAAVAAIYEKAEEAVSSSYQGALENERNRGNKLAKEVAQLRGAKAVLVRSERDTGMAKDSVLSEARKAAGLWEREKTLLDQQLIDTKRVYEELLETVKNGHCTETAVRERAFQDKCEELNRMSHMFKDVVSAHELVVANLKDQVKDRDREVGRLLRRDGRNGAATQK